jgi:hypothetical protein
MGLVLIYVPFSLQRRFLLGLYIPTAGLAILGLEVLRHRFAARARLLTGLLVGLSLPTNLALILILLLGASAHAPELYLTRDEAAALRWIDANTPRQSLVLASPQIGLWIPGYTGRRVLYGHPYETAHAQEQKELVELFYAFPSPNFDLFPGQRVDWVFAGPRERAIGSGLDLSSLDLAFSSGKVQIYQNATLSSTAGPGPTLRRAIP